MPLLNQISRILHQNRFFEKPETLICTIKASLTTHLLMFTHIQIIFSFTLIFFGNAPSINSFSKTIPAKIGDVVSNSDETFPFSSTLVTVYESSSSSSVANPVTVQQKITFIIKMKKN